MHSHAATIVAIAANLAMLTLAAPVLEDVIPSVHPLTGPAPPSVPSPPRGSSKVFSPSADAGQAVGLVSQAPGKYWTGWSNVKKLFVFGDSYTQTGFDPAGSQPSTIFPLGNPAYPGYTSSNGPNWVDYLTVAYNRSLIETYNLAYGGATVDANLVKPYQPSVLSLIQQVNDEFFPYYVDETTAEWTSANSLFATFIGINDVTSSWNQTLNAEIIKVYASLIEEEYEAGARNFLFLNVPPTDKSPQVTVQGDAGALYLAPVIADFNEQVRQMARNFATYADATVFYFDTNALFDQVLANPASFPQTAVYKNTTAYCAAYQNGTPAQNTFDPSCGLPVNQYLWLNSLHPTFPIHDALAQQIAKQLEAGTTVS